MPRVREDGALQVEVERADTEVLIRAIGELDLASAEAFEGELRRAIAEDAPVVLDLSEVSFIDSTGIRCLLVAVELAKLDGDRFSVRRELTPAVERSLELTGLTDRLPFSD